MVRIHLVPAIMSIRLLGPRLLVAKFRGARRNLTVYVAHAPHSGASDDDRQAFYTDFSEAFSERFRVDLGVNFGSVFDFFLASFSEAVFGAVLGLVVPPC